MPRFINSDTIFDPESFRLALIEMEGKECIERDGGYSFNSCLKAWRDAAAFVKEHPEFTVEDAMTLADDSQKIIYGNGGYRRYRISNIGRVVAIASSFDNREDMIAKAKGLCLWPS